MSSALKEKDKRALLTEALNGSKRRGEELESQPGSSRVAEPESAQIVDRIWDVFSAMIEGACLNEIIYDDTCRPIDYVILRCNPAYESIFGQSAQGAIGSRASELYGSDEAPNLTIYAEVAASGNPVNFETYLAPMDKHFHILVLSLEPKRFITVFTDITERKIAEIALIESERKTRTILDQTYHLIGLLKPDGTLIDANRSALEFIAVDASGVLGKPFWETSWWTHDKQQQDRLRKDIKRAAAGEFVKFESYHPGPDGEIRYIDGSLKPIRDEHGEVVYIVPEGRDITEYIRAERNLRESEERFRSLVETSSDWIWEIDQNGVYTYVSPKCEEFLGYTPDEVIGVSIFEMLSPKEKQRFGDMFRDHVRDRKSVTNIENVRIHKGGHKVIFETSGEPILDGNGDLVGFRGVSRDITERKRVEEEFQKLALAVKYSGELVNMATLEGRMTFINDAGAKMLGIEQHEVERTYIMQVIPEHLQDLVTNELLPALMRGETWQGELQYKNLKTGKLTDVHAMTYTVPDPVTGKPLFLANVSMNITARKQAERERKVLEDQVQHMQKLESLGVLAGGIAHDFNNLLVGILGNADLALRRLPDNSPIRENLNGIENSAVRAADLCQQMLAYSGKGRFAVEVVDLREIVEEMSQMLDVSISKKTSCSYHFVDDVPCVEADATQIRQIVLNLITNASEALGDKSGAISLSVSSKQCDREYLSGSFIDEELPAGTYVCLEVTDNGQGMDGQTMERIFDPFFTTKFTGRGLGLSAVLGIIRGHKGSIKVHSEVGKGTRFQVLLPATTKKKLEQSDQKLAPKTCKGGGTILLVDDDERIRAIMPEMLADCGFDVLTASDGREAVDIYERRKDEIILVVLDHTMPVMDGEETFRELQRIKNDVRVLLCSGYQEQDITRRFIGTRPAGFIQKPFRMDDLLSKLEDVLG